MTKTVCALFAVAGLWAAAPAVAGNMGADEARRFVVGNLFSFTCFEGTSGEARVYADGSVGGVIRLRGSGPPAIRDSSARNAAGQGRRHLRPHKWNVVRGMLRSRSHRRKELSRFAPRNWKVRVLPIHQAAQSARDGQHGIAALHPADCIVLKPPLNQSGAPASSSLAAKKEDLGRRCQGAAEVVGGTGVGGNNATVPSELLSYAQIGQWPDEGASRATSAPARACSVIPAGTTRTRSPAFSVSIPTRRCGETDANFLIAYRTPHLSDMPVCPRPHLQVFPPTLALTRMRHCPGRPIRGQVPLT